MTGCAFPWFTLRLKQIMCKKHLKGFKFEDILTQSFPQAVTLAVYLYFLASLMAKQFLISLEYVNVESGSKQDMEIFFPVFLFIEVDLHKARPDGTTINSKINVVPVLLLHGLAKRGRDAR